MLADYPSIAGAIGFALLGGAGAARVASAYAGSTIPVLLGVSGCTSLAVWSLFVATSHLRLAEALMFGWCLFVLALIDILAYRLPNSITYFLIVSGLGLAFLLDAPRFTGDTLERLLGACGGFAAVAAIAWTYRTWGGKEGIGFGDAKLLAASGAWLGWEALPGVVLFASLMGLIWVLFALIRNDREPAALRVPFGAPLSLATWLAWLYGPVLIRS